MLLELSFRYLYIYSWSTEHHRSFSRERASEHITSIDADAEADAVVVLTSYFFSGSSLLVCIHKQRRKSGTETTKHSINI